MKVNQTSQTKKTVHVAPIMGATFVILGTACSSSAAPAPQPVVTRAALMWQGDLGSNPQFQSCYDAALSKQPGLAVHGLALVIGREDRVLFADADIPQAPELARCISEKVMAEPSAYLAHRLKYSGHMAHQAWVVNFFVNVGAVNPRTRTDWREFRKWSYESTLGGLRRGLLRDSDDIVQNVVFQRSERPSPDQEAQLEACYRASLPNHPGLAVHAWAPYIAKGNKIVAAEVSVPGAPELSQCLVNKMMTWEPRTFSPPPSDRATMGQFVVHLGGGPKFIDYADEELSAQKNRIISEARTRGLIAESDFVARSATKDGGT